MTVRELAELLGRANPEAVVTVDIIIGIVKDYMESSIVVCTVDDTVDESTMGPFTLVVEEIVNSY